MAKVICVIQSIEKNNFYFAPLAQDALASLWMSMFFLVINENIQKAENSYIGLIKVVFKL